MINEDGRIQLLRQATQLPRGIVPEHEVLQDILLALGERQRKVSAAGVFQELGSLCPELEGLSHTDLGKLGCQPAGEGSPQAVTVGARGSGDSGESGEGGRE